MELPTRKRFFLRSLLISSALAFLAVPALSVAQNNAADQGQNDQAEQLGTVTVTGSRIRQADMETAQPVVRIGRAEIKQTGFTNIAQLLQNLTTAGTPPISREQVLLAGEAVGGTYIDLRNLGAERTLILINGTRLGATNGAIQDLSQVPLAAVDHIEILKDGASAIYGSDAIAGVVNIITRNHFEGAEASAYVGQYGEDDGMKQIYSLTYGASSDRGHIMIAAEYSKEEPVWARDRWFSKYPNTTRHPKEGWSVLSQWGAFAAPGVFSDSPTELWCGGYFCTLNKGGDPSDLSDYHVSYSDGGNADKSNYAYQQMLKTGLKRRSVYVHADYDITDHIRTKLNFLYNNREATQQVAGYPFRSFAFSLPGSDELVGLSPDSYYNPTNKKLLFRRRGWEAPRRTTSKLTTYRVRGTLAGDFLVGQHMWNWDFTALFNKNDGLKVRHGWFNLMAMKNALGPSFRNSQGAVQCGAGPNDNMPLGSAPGQCIPWNPFYPAGQIGEGSLEGNPGLQTHLFPWLHDTNVTQTISYEANISGSIVTLPAGDLAFALGSQWRKERGKFVPDSMSQAHISTDLGMGPTEGSYNVRSYYAELQIPLLRDLPGAQQLALNIADRDSKYSSFGSTNNAKYSFTWRPTDELLVRGTYAEGFRAPAIANLFGGISSDYAFYTDPCDFNHEAGQNADVASRCTSGFQGQNPVPAGFLQLQQGGGTPCDAYPCQTPTPFISGSTPTLEPEESVTKTAGIVYSPEWAPGVLDITLDWFHIRIENAITGDTMRAILYDCYVLGVESRCSSALFTRNPSTGQVNFGHYGLRNAGWWETQGWDFGVHYVFPQTSFGLFDLTWNTTYIDYLDTKADDKPDTPVHHLTGWGANFRVRSNASLRWSFGAFGVTWTTRYYASMKEVCSYDTEPPYGPACNLPQIEHNDHTVNANEVGSNTFHDVQFRYNTPFNSTVAVGVNNVFDHYAGPMYSDPNSGYDYYGGFSIGRFYYLQYTQSF